MEEGEEVEDRVFCGDFFGSLGGLVQVMEHLVDLEMEEVDILKVEKQWNFST